MSFILDALRKSEHERQRFTVPSLSYVPTGTPRRELPAWAMVLIVVLTVGVIGLGSAWWRSLQAPATVRLERAAPAPEPQPTTATAVPAMSESAPSPTPNTRPPTALLAPAAPPADALALSDAVPAKERGAPPTPAPTSPSAQSATGATTLPSAAALIARGVVLPPLRLELHAFSAVPSERFVFINGRKYVEGDTLAEGPQVVTIEPSGAVLSQLGQRFLLAPE